jgi:DNA-binding CsgD family transcriptional regulator/tetratricopeptide (TPR) repeat protein
MVVAIRDRAMLERATAHAARPLTPRLEVVPSDGRLLDPIHGAPDAPPLYGRTIEQATLRWALNDALAGRGRLALIGGEAGIGKTALGEALAREASLAGALVLTAGCDDLAPTPPYGPWIEVIRAFQADQGRLRLPDGLANADVIEALAGQDALVGQAIGFLAELAAVQPVVLILEDLHWADLGSLELLRFVARRLPELSVLVVATYRDTSLSPDHPLGQVLPRLARDHAPLRLDLRRLDAPAVRALVADRYALSASDEARLAAHLDRFAEGNPFFVDEVLRALEQSGALSPQDTGWAVGDLEAVQVPLLVRQLVSAQAAALGESARRLIQLAAVIGATVPMDLWGKVAGGSEDELVEAVEGALAAGLLVETADRHGLRFRHALIRQALYDEVVLPRRRAWHRRVAEALATRTHPDPDAVAHHFSRAADARASTWLVEAGHRAARRDASRDALERYTAALERLPDDPAYLIERGWLLWELAEQLRYGDPPQALAYLNEADRIVAASGDAGLATVTRWTRVRLRGYLGHPFLDDLEEIIAAFEALPAADRIRAESSGSLNAPSRGILAQWAGLQGRYDVALRAAEAGVAAGSTATRPAEINALADALSGLGLAHAALGRPAEAAEAFGRAIGHYQATGNRAMACWALRWQIEEVAIAYGADEPGARRRLAATFAELCPEEDRLSVGEDGRPIVPLFALAFLEGDWQAAESLAGSDLKHSSWRLDSVATLAAIDRARGRRHEAWSRIHQGLPAGPATAPTSPFYLRRLPLVRLAAELALDEGRSEVARAWIDAHDRWLDYGGRVLDRAASHLLRARLALVDGDRAAARARAETALADAIQPRQPLVLLAARRFLGEIATSEGDLAEAGRHLDAAQALTDLCDAPLERLLTHLARAELLTVRRDAAGAASALDAARVIARPLGLVPALERADTIQARLEASATPAERETATGGADTAGLSPREVEVLQLVARGLTDAEVGTRLYISPRTVARHLQSVYNKLAVNSRTAAAAFAFERGLV